MDPTRLGHLALVVTGAALVLLALVDVFYTVLFPTSGHGPVRRPLARLLRLAFTLTRRLRPPTRRRLMPYAGPLEVALTLLAWFVLLLVGWAAIYQPALGDAVRAAQGSTDRSWGTALYFSGYTLTTLGLGDLVATTPTYRALVVVEAASGFISLTLAISYFVSVYGTLTGRRTFARALHDRSGGTGRGSALVVALWQEGPVAGATHLLAIADGLRELAQTHSAYPVLRAFHYRRDYDTLPRILLTCWELATLLRTCVGPGDGTRPELTGVAVAEIESAAASLTAQLAGVPPAALGDGRADPEQERGWREHHAELVRELAAGGVPVSDGSAAGYVAARARWDAALARVAAELVHDWPDDLRPVPGGAAATG